MFVAVFEVLLTVTAEPPFDIKPVKNKQEMEKTCVPSFGLNRIEVEPSKQKQNQSWTLWKAGNNMWHFRNVQNRPAASKQGSSRDFNLQMYLIYLKNVKIKKDRSWKIKGKKPINDVNTYSWRGQQIQVWREPGKRTQVKHINGREPRAVLR